MRALRALREDSLMSDESSQSGRVFVDWGKLAQITIIIIATTVLGVLDVIDRSTVTLTIGAASGYIFGNGKSVKEGHEVAPLLRRRRIIEVDDPEHLLDDGDA
jgi:hypothetical protein